MCEFHLNQNKLYQQKYRDEHKYVPRDDPDYDSDFLVKTSSDEDSEDEVDTKVSHSTEVQVTDTKMAQVIENHTNQVTKEVTTADLKSGVFTHTKESQSESRTRIQTIIHTVQTKAKEESVAYMKTLVTRALDSPTKEIYYKNLVGLHTSERIEEIQQNLIKDFDKQYDEQIAEEIRDARIQGKDVLKEIRSFRPPGMFPNPEERSAEQATKNYQVNTRELRKEYLGKDIAALIFHNKFNLGEFEVDFDSVFPREISKGDIYLSEFQSRFAGQDDKYLKEEVMNSPSRYALYCECELTQKSTGFVAKFYLPVCMLKIFLQRTFVRAIQDEVVSSIHDQCKAITLDADFFKRFYPEEFCKCEPYLDKFTSLFDSCELIQWKAPERGEETELMLDLQEFGTVAKSLKARNIDLSKYFCAPMYHKLQNYLHQHHQVWDRKHEKMLKKRSADESIDRKLKKVKDYKEALQKNYVEAGVDARGKDVVAAWTKMFPDLASVYGGSEENKRQKEERLRKEDDMKNWMN